MVLHKKSKNENEQAQGMPQGRDDGRGTALTLSLSILLLYVSLAVIIHFFGINRDNIEAQKMDDLVSVDVIHEDETTTNYSGNIYAPPLKTDTLFVRVPLPKSRWISSAVLCFNYYNANIRVFASDNRLIYSGKSAELSAENLTGHMVVRATIPNYCWGKYVDIRIDPLEDNTTSVINGIYVMKSGDSVFYPVLLAGQFTLALIFFVFLDSLLLLSLFIIMRLRGNKVTDGIFLMLFCLIGSIWALCYTGFIYVCSGSSRLCAFGEYYVVFLTMPILAGYFSLQNVSRPMKLYLRILTAILTVFAIVVYIGEVNHLKFNIISAIPAFRILLLVVVASCSVVLIGLRNRHDASRFVQNVGLITTFILVVLEVVRLNFVRSAGEEIYHARFIADANLTMPICIVFVSTLMISYMSRFMRTRQLEQENETLQSLATRDSLTGIPNRLYINDALKELAKNEVHEYVMFFLDVNDLKKANDIYGHESGDKMLKLIGRAMREAAEGMKGFYGRYGGDEFVACIYDVSAADSFEKRFTDIIKKANSKNYMPFEVSVAIGKLVHLDNDESSPEEVLKTADELMYQRKAAMKGAKNIR